jgi:hypothetical protein
MPIFFRRGLHKHEKNRLVRMFDPGYEDQGIEGLREAHIHASINLALPRKHTRKIYDVLSGYYPTPWNIKQTAYRELRKYQKEHHGGARNIFPYRNEDGILVFYEAPNDRYTKYIIDSFVDGTTFGMEQWM